MLKRRQKPSDDSSGTWMTTYSDTVTLLLCFFVLLFASSTINETKWRQIVESFTQGGYVVQPSDYETSSELPLEPPKESPNDRLYSTIKDYIDNHNLSSKVFLTKGENTVTLRFGDTILFDPDRTVLREDGKKILNNICDILKESIELIEMIHIEGHTAANPKGKPQFTNTFEFSTQRAVNVLKYALKEKNIDVKKLSAVGYGQYHPIGDNETAEGRSKNRRVEIVVTSYDSLESD
ncbi:MAG: flagellar motor protein MotB [Oscillospiraceae bacterium]|jgi:chemotaxis protein MotB|nr:flagellar motor protein MotB [Oscillospiraceae bacterium]